ncbi:hypothetical protein Q8A73_000804 [Channa argus]|nr:hypothetical protein Q8A73_000804 [Channa argus]
MLDSMKEDIQNSILGTKRGKSKDTESLIWQHPNMQQQIRAPLLGEQGRKRATCVKRKTWVFSKLGERWPSPTRAHFLASSGVQPWNDGSRFWKRCWERHLSRSRTPSSPSNLNQLCLCLPSQPEDEQEAMPSAQGTDALSARDNTPFFSLYRRAAEKLEATWPTPQPAKKP